MSQKNDAYQVLIDQGLSGRELEKAKARIRSAKSTKVRGRGITKDEAEQQAIRAELARLASRAEPLEIPTPPEGSGLTARGARNPKDGQSPLHWSFAIYDISKKDELGRIGKKRRIKFSEIPSSITSLFPAGIEETLALKRRLESEQAGMMRRIEEQARWIEENKAHHELFKLFIEERTRGKKERNRKDKRGNEATGLRVAFSFFLSNEKGKNHFLPDVREWSRYYDDYLDYLKALKPQRRNAKGETIRKNTQKNYITALNKYVAFVWRKGKFQGQPPRCENYKKSDFERRGVEAVITPDEEAAFVNYFRQAGLPQVAGFMKVGNHIAARPGELLGISLADVRPGPIPDNASSPVLKAMKLSLESIAKERNLRVYGYIVIRGQIDEQSRQSDHSLDYYPTKTAKAVEPKSFRYCPIVDEEVWKTIADLIQRQKALFQEKRYGDQLRNYLLFEGLTLAGIQEHFRVFRLGAGRKWSEKLHTPHCCRHTGCTYWVALAGNNMDAAQKILGHADISETLAYAHLAELYAEELKRLAAGSSGDAFFDQIASTVVG